MWEIIERVNEIIREKGYDWYKVNEFGMQTDKNGTYYYVKYDAGNKVKTVSNSIAKVYYKGV